MINNSYLAKRRLLLIIIFLANITILHGMEPDTNRSEPATSYVFDVLTGACALRETTTVSLLGRTEAIKWCITQGIPVDGVLNTATGMSSCPLLFASWAKDPCLVEWLLDHHAQKSITFLAGQGYTSCLHALFQIESSDPETEAQRLSLIIRLYQKKQPLSAENIIFEQLEGKKPLLMAVTTKNLDKVSRCLAFGLNPDVQDARGRTGLMLAAEKRWYPGIMLLLEYGADPHKVDGQGRTIEEYMRKNFNTQVATILRESVGYACGKIPLQYANYPIDLSCAQEIMAINAATTLGTQPIMNLSDIAEIPPLITALATQEQRPLKIKIKVTNNKTTPKEKRIKEDEDGDYIAKEYRKKKRVRERPQKSNNSADQPLQ